MSIKRDSPKQEWDDLNRAFTEMVDKQGGRLANVCQEVESSLTMLNWTQLLQLGVVLVMFVLGVLVWTQAKEDVGKCLFALLVGAFTIPLISYVGIKYTTRVLSRALVYVSFN